MKVPYAPRMGTTDTRDRSAIGMPMISSGTRVTHAPIKCCWDSRNRGQRVSVVGSVVLSLATNVATGFPVDPRFKHIDIDV